MTLHIRRNWSELFVLIALTGLFATPAIGQQNQASSCEQALQPLQKQLDAITAQLYDSAEKQIGQITDLNAGALGPGIAAAVKVADGVSKTSEAIQTGKPTAAVIQAAQPALEAIKATSPDKYETAVGAVQSLVKAYDAYRKGDYAAAVDAVANEMVVRPVTLAVAKEALSQAAKKTSAQLLSTVYDTAYGGTKLVGEQRTFRQLQDQHEQILRKMGDIRRRTPSCSTNALAASVCVQPKEGAARRGFAGTWRGQDRRMIQVTASRGFYAADAVLPNENAKSFQTFRREGDVLVSKHAYTVAEAEKWFEIPAEVASQAVANMPMEMMTLDLATDDCAIRAEIDEISAVGFQQLIVNGVRTKDYKITHYTPHTSYEIWERVK